MHILAQIINQYQNKQNILLFALLTLAYICGNSSTFEVFLQVMATS